MAKKKITKPKTEEKKTKPKAEKKSTPKMKE